VIAFGLERIRRDCSSASGPSMTSDRRRCWRLKASRTASSPVMPQRMKGKRRKRPRWGLAQLMRPAKAASDVSFVCLPLCYPPNAIVQRSTRLLDPVVPCKPPCQPGCIKKSAPTRSNVKLANNAFLQIESRKIRGWRRRCYAGRASRRWPKKDLRREYVLLGPDVRTAHNAEMVGCKPVVGRRNATDWLAT
jgi:hypothetical protein